MDLEERVARLEEEVRELKEQLRLLHAPGAFRTAPGIRETISGTRGEPSDQTRNRERHAAAPPRAPVDWEKEIGKVWLPRVFIVLLLIGAMWGFIAAVNSGWITPWLRCAVGFIASIMMAALGQKQLGRGHRPLALCLIGGSIPMLTLSVFAAHFWYGLIGVWLAMALLIFSMIGEVYLAMRNRSQTLLIICSLAAMLHPFLLKLDGASPFLAPVYLAVFASLLWWLANRNSFAIAQIVSIASLQPALIAIHVMQDGLPYPVLAAVILQHAVIVCAAMLGRTKVQAYAVYASAGFVMIWFQALLPEGAADTVLLAPLFSYAVLCLASFLLKINHWPLWLPPLTLTLAQWIANVLDADITVPLLLVQGALAIAVGRRTKSIVQMLLGGILVAIPAIYVISNGAPSAIASIDSLNLAAATAVIASLPRLLRGTQLYTALWWARLLVVLWAVSCMTITALQRSGEDVQGMSLSFAWLAYASTVILLGFRRDNKALRLAGLALLGLTVSKLILFDLSELDIAVRAVLFLIVGAVGMLLSRVFYHK